MKMMNVLDMSGNQIQNALVHNGNVTGSGTQLTAAAGSFAYNEADRSLYYGYENEYGNKLWSRLVDVAHLSQSLSGDDVYKWAKSISESNVEIDGNTFALGADAVVSLLEQGGNAYSWGDHRTAGYVVFEPIIAKDVDYSRITTDKLTLAGQVKGTVDLVVDKSRGRLFVEGLGFDNRVVYFQDWSAIPLLGIKDKAFYYNNRIIGLEGNSIVVGNYGRFSVFDDGSAKSFVTNLISYGLTPEFVLASLTNGDSAYNWGNHADAGYAKAYKVGVIERYTDVTNNQQSGEPNTNNVYFGGAFFNERTGVVAKFIAKGSESVPEEQREYKYYKTWAKGSNYPGSLDYHKEGVLLFAGSNVYKYESGAWVLYYSGVSGNVDGRIKAIEDLLNVGDNLANTIDTWNDLTKFLGGIEPSDNGLYTWMTNTESSINDINQALDDKADKSEVIMKPTEVGNDDDVLTLQPNGSAKWSTRKIVSHLGNIVEEREDLHGNDWYIDITSIGTTDVSVSLYLDSDGRGTWEQFIADVSVYEYQEGDPVVSGIRAKVSFGTIPAQDVKAVIIA